MCFQYSENQENATHVQTWVKVDIMIFQNGLMINLRIYLSLRFFSYSWENFGQTLKINFTYS